MSRPSLRAVTSHSVITVSAFARASCRVEPSAAQPGSSGTAAINAWSSSLQYRMIAYLVIEPFQTVHTDEPRVGSNASYYARRMKCSIGGADPLVRAGRPRPASGATISASCKVREADGGVGRGPGGPPHHLCGFSVVGRVSGICVQDLRHISTCGLTRGQIEALRT